MILSRHPGGWRHTGVPAPSRAWRLSWIKQLICEIKQKYLLPCEVSRAILEYPTWEDYEGQFSGARAETTRVPWDTAGFHGVIHGDVLCRAGSRGSFQCRTFPDSTVLWPVLRQLDWALCVFTKIPPPPTADSARPQLQESGPTLLRGKTNPTAAGGFYHRDN